MILSYYYCCFVITKYIATYLSTGLSNRHLKLTMCKIDFLFFFLSSVHCLSVTTHCSQNWGIISDSSPFLSSYSVYQIQQIHEDSVFKIYPCLSDSIAITIIPDTMLSLYLLSLDWFIFSSPCSPYNPLSHRSHSNFS